MNDSKAKYKIFISLVVITLFIIGFTPFLELSPSNSRDSQQQLDNPKTNANEIILITPENKTYNKPITGYYPATYGFENDILNSFPYGWIDGDVSTCETKVIGTLDGHNSIVQQYDNHGSAAAQMSKDIPATAIINVEFWVRTDLLLFIYFNVRDSLSTYNTWDLHNLPGFSVDTWHHVRFVINTITDKFDSYLDGVLKDNQANLPNPMNDVDQIQFNTAPSHLNYNIWWDAIGGNWDPNYNIGDNRYKGLLLDFDSNDLEWMGYTYDGQPLSTIFGDKVIPFYDKGAHSIQLIGKDFDGVFYCSKIVSYTCTYFATGFLYAQSSVSHAWTGGTWTDEDAAITSVELPGDYFVIYTATYRINDDSLFGIAEGCGWVQLVTDDGGIIKTRRLYDCLNTVPFGPDNIYGTLIVADKVTLGYGGVKAQIHFIPLLFDKMILLDRSICAIPLEEGYEYVNSETLRSWSDEEIKEDPDIRLESLTGDYFAIYTASFSVTDEFPLDGVHSNGWTMFSDNPNIEYNSLDYTNRHWEFPAYFSRAWMGGTLLIADKIQLDNTNLYIKLRLDQRGPTDVMTIGKRSLILIPLVYDFRYESRTSRTEDLNQDIVFEDINNKCFVMYTATNFILNEYPDYILGWGWAAYNDGINTIDYTKRYYEFPHGYGTGLRKTSYVVEILDLWRNDIKVEYYWDPNDDEVFSLEDRSMILIPFY